MLKNLLFCFSLFIFFNNCCGQHVDSTAFNKTNFKLTKYEKKCYFIGIPVGTFTFCVTVVLFEKIKLKK